MRGSSSSRGVSTPRREHPPDREEFSPWWRNPISACVRWLLPRAPSSPIFPAKIKHLQGLYLLPQFGAGRRDLLNRLLYIWRGCRSAGTEVANHNLLVVVEAPTEAGAEVLCFNAALIGPEADVRQWAEAAMIFRHKPPCNTEHIDNFPFDTTTITTGGRNADASIQLHRHPDGEGCNQCLRPNASMTAEAGLLPRRGPGFHLTPELSTRGGRCMDHQSGPAISGTITRASEQNGRYPVCAA